MFWKMVKPMFSNKSVNKGRIVMVKDSEIFFRKDKSGRYLQ